MQWNWDWPTALVISIVTLAVGALVYAHRLPPEVFYTFAAGLVLRQPVSGVGKAVKDSLRPPPMPPETKP